MVSSEVYEKPLEELTPHEVGMLGEQLTASFVESRMRCRVVDRNWRCEYGEADIIAIDDVRNEHVFIEVKTRTSSRLDTSVMPELAVDAEKLARYERLVAAYQAGYAEPPRVRVDVAAVTLKPGRLASMHYKVDVFGQGRVS